MTVYGLASAASAQPQPEGFRYGHLQATYTGAIYTYEPVPGAGTPTIMAPIFTHPPGGAQVFDQGLLVWNGDALSPYPGIPMPPNFTVYSGTHINGELWVTGYPGVTGPPDPFQVWHYHNGQWVDATNGFFTGANVQAGILKAAGGIPWMGGTLFTGSGITHLAKFAGVWTSAGVNLTDAPAFVDVLNGDLWVCGPIAAGGASGGASSLARWNPATGWSNLAGGPPIRVQSVIDTPQGVVACGYVDGTQTGRVYLWNGTAWSQMGPDFNQIVNAAAWYDGEILLLRPVANGNQHPYDIARWTGTAWQPWPGVVGIDSSQTGAPRTLMVNGDELILSGSQYGALAATADTLLRWKVGASYKPGRGWRTMVEELDTGVTGSFPTPYIGSDGANLFLLANGFLNTPVPSGNVLLLGPGQTEWERAPGTYKGLWPHQVLRFHGETLIAGGNDGSSLVLGPQEVGPLGLVRWNGQRSVPMVAGLAGSGPATTGGASVTGLALLNGRLFELNNNGVGEWDGVQWQPVGRVPDNTVRAVCTWRNQMVVGGDFTTIGTQTSMTRIAQFDGTKWLPLGTGMNGRVRALAVYNDELYAAGDFTNAGGVPVTGVARWNGAAWSAAGQLQSNQGSLFLLALQVYAGELFASGNFTSTAGQPLGFIARWNGQTWRAVGNTASPTLRPDSVPAFFATHDDELYFTGPVGWVEARWCGPFARWYQPGRIAVVQQPAPAAAPAGGQATLTVSALGASGFQWRRAATSAGPWTLFVDGPSPGGGTIQGAATDTLTLTGLTAGDAGMYQCEVINDAGSVYSTPAALTVTP